MSEAADRWNPLWFRTQVQSRGPWDFKHEFGARYEDFGNFHYGATGRAFGFSERRLLREAGRAQQDAGTSRTQWGSPGWLLNPWGGESPYGDDPYDQTLISRGTGYCECMGQR